MKKTFISLSLTLIVVATGCSMISGGSTTVFTGNTVNANNDTRSIEIACADKKVFVVPMETTQIAATMSSEEQKAYDMLPETGKNIQNALNTLFKTTGSEDKNVINALEKSNLKVKEIIAPDSTTGSFLINLTGTMNITDACNKKIAKSQMTETVRNLTGGQGFVLKLDGDARKFEKAFE